MEVVAISDKGLVRPNNEDSYLVDEVRGLLVICDGMGGHNGGEVASEMTVNIINREYGRESEIPLELQRVIDMANTSVWNRSRMEPALNGMGTTVTAAVYRSGILHVAHVGDSGLYIIRPGSIYKLTHDHTLAQQLLADGVLKPEDMRSNPYNHILTRALGVEERVIVDHYQEHLEPGDFLLLCSDGLSDLVNENEIYAIVKESGSTLETAVRGLVERALGYGGIDNITAILSRI